MIAFLSLAGGISPLLVSFILFCYFHGVVAEEVTAFKSVRSANSFYICWEVVLTTTRDQTSLPPRLPSKSATAGNSVPGIFLLGRMRQRITQGHIYMITTRYASGYAIEKGEADM